MRRQALRDVLEHGVGDGDLERLGVIGPPFWVWRARKPSSTAFSSAVRSRETKCPAPGSTSSSPAGSVRARSSAVSTGSITSWSPQTTSAGIRIRRRSSSLSARSSAQVWRQAPAQAHPVVGVLAVLVAQRAQLGRPGPAEDARDVVRAAGPRGADQDDAVRDVRALAEQAQDGAGADREADDRGGALAGLVDQGQQVEPDLLEAQQPLRVARGAVAAQVGRQHPVAAGERRALVLPVVRTGARATVDEHDERAGALVAVLQAGTSRRLEMWHVRGSLPRGPVRLTLRRFLARLPWESTNRLVEHERGRGLL